MLKITKFILKKLIWILDKAIALLDYIQYLKDRKEYLKNLDILTIEQMQKRISDYLQYLRRMYGEEEINRFKRFWATKKVNQFDTEHGIWKRQLIITEEYLQQKENW